MIQNEKLAAVGRLAASVSHEIRNPLESITNLLYLLATDDALSLVSREYLAMAQAEVSRVAEIATQTLHLNRQSTRPTLVCAPELISDVIKLYLRRLTQARISVEARYASQRPFLCYEGDLRQVLNNLIANAIDAMEGGGRLLIRVHDAADYGPARGAAAKPGVRITIADTGCGMSDATKARVFEPFYTTKELAGTGLGLWISSEIVGRHGGHLHMHSSMRQAGHGTVFSLFLPLKCA
jgi:signal transduction histidine kinase